MVSIQRSIMRSRTTAAAAWNQSRSVAVIGSLPMV
jgi:hypothetical protein